MIFTLSAIDILRKIAASLGKFVKRIRIEFDGESIRIRTIDDEDFCYIDIHLKKDFFDSVKNSKNLTLLVDISNLSNMLKTLAKESKIEIIAKPSGIQIRSKTKKLQYTLTPLIDDSLSEIAEPAKLVQPVTSIVPSSEFIKAIQGASVVSNEVYLEPFADNIGISAASDIYSFTATVPATTKFKDKKSDISGQVILRYFKAIEPLIKIGNEIHLGFGSNMPVQLSFEYYDLCTFSFSLAPHKTTKRVRTDRKGESLPRLTASRFSDFILYLSAFPQGVPIEDLQNGHLETKGRDYSRLAARIDFIEISGPDLKLTETGDQFAVFLRSNTNVAKDYLHAKLIQLIPSYEVLMSIVSAGHTEAEYLFTRLNKEISKRKEGTIDRQDFSTLIGLAGWCDKIDRRLGVVYSTTNE